MLSLIIGAAFKRALAWRGDGLPHLHYFTPSEYGVDGYEPFEFKSSAKEGHTLRGAKYFVPGIKPKAIVIFFHGIGAGHTSYSHEIAEIAKQGYTVFAYDNTGSMLSGGQSIENIAVAARDQKDFFHYLDTREDARDLPRYAIGHSWGGYAALISLQQQYRVDKCVSLSGFYSAPDMAIAAVPALAKFKGSIASFLRKNYGIEAIANGIDLAKNPNKKVLYIQGDKDEQVSFDLNYKKMEKELKDCPNVKLMAMKGRGHNCYFSKRAEVYYIKLGKELKQFGPYRDLNYQIDYDLLMEQDRDIMKAIFDFFDN